MRTSLVVGVNGMIGSALYARLQTHGAPVYGTTHRTTHHDPHLFHLNLRDDPATWQWPNTHFDVAYLCAGICRMNLCEDDPTNTHHVNVIGMSALAKILASRGTFIVFLSTNQVFSGEQAFMSADGERHPINEYGRQKALLETFLQSHCERHAIVRLTKVVEPRMSLIQTWIDQLNQGQPIRVFSDMPLAPVSLNHVLRTLERIGEAQQSGCYHLSGVHDVSYFDIGLYLAERLGCPKELVQATSAISAGIKKNFLPRFTSLDCSSTILIGGTKPPHYTDVLQECFTLPT